MLHPENLNWKGFILVSFGRIFNSRYRFLLKYILPNMKKMKKTVKN